MTGAGSVALIRHPINFELGRQMLLREMLPHTCIGHPLAAVLSSVGQRGLAERIHYATLPTRTKRRYSPGRIRYDHVPELLWNDAVWVPICSIFQAYGYYWLAAEIFARCANWQAALAFKACGYYHYDKKNVGPFQFKLDDRGELFFPEYELAETLRLRADLWDEVQELYGEYDQAIHWNPMGWLLGEVPGKPGVKRVDAIIEYYSNPNRPDETTHL